MAPGAAAGPGPNVAGAIAGAPDAAAVAAVPATGPDTTHDFLADGVTPNPDFPVAFVLVDFTASDAFHWIERNTGKIILQDANVPASRLNFSTGSDATGGVRKLPRSEVLQGLETLLTMNKIILLPMDDHFIRAVPGTNTLNGNSTALATNATLQEPANQNVYGMFFHIEHMTADDAATILTPFVSPLAALIVFQRSNDLFITDTQMNLNRASTILKRADVPAEVLEDFLFVQLKNAKASDVLTHLQALTTNAGGRGGPTAPLLKYVSTASFIEDDRTNQILVITPKGNSGMIKDLIDKMDIDVDPLTRSEVFSIKQADATPLATILRQVVTGQQQTATTGGAGATGARGGRGGAAAGGVAGGGGGVFPGAGGGAVFVPPTVAAITTSATESARDQQFSPYVTIVPDDRSNSIVVYGTPSDIKQIGSLIDKIDTVLAQVRIEVVITEVTLSSGQVSGLSSFGLDYHFAAGNGTTTAGGVGGPHDVNFTTGVGAPPNATAPAFTLQGSITNFGLDAVFNVASSNSKVRVLSAPAITTTHNRQATISVTENRPILSSTTTGTINPAAVGNNVTSTITYQSIGITLIVTPMVGANGVIQMNISQTAQNIVSEQSINGVDQPIIGSRVATTFVSVHDGDVLVLGGLQTTEHHKTNSKVFLLGDIPLIGELFRPVLESDQVTELILFVKPTVVGGANSADVIAKETATHSLASKSVVDYLQNGYVVAPPELDTSLSKQSATPAGLPHH